MGLWDSKKVATMLHGKEKANKFRPFGSVRDGLTAAALGSGAIMGGKEGSQSDALDRDVRQSLGLKEKDWLGRNKGAILGSAAGFAGGLAGRAIAKKTGLSLMGLGTLAGIGAGSKLASTVANKYVADQNRRQRDKEILAAKNKEQSNYTNNMYQTRQFNKLTDSVSKHQNALIGAGVGASSGVAGGYLMDKKAKRKGNWVQRNAGAPLGGVGGAGLGAAVGHYGFGRSSAPAAVVAGPKHGGVGSSYISGNNRATVLHRNDDKFGTSATRKVEQLRGVAGGKVADPRTLTVTQGGLPTGTSGSVQRGLDTEAFLKSNRSKQAKELSNLKNQGFVIKSKKAGFGGKSIYNLVNKVTGDEVKLHSDYVDYLASKYYSGDVNSTTMNTSKTEASKAQGLWNRVKSGAGVAGRFGKDNWKGAAIGAVGLGAAGAGIGRIVASRRGKNKKKAMAIGAGVGSVIGGLAGAGIQQLTRR